MHISFTPSPSERYENLTTAKRFRFRGRILTAAATPVNNDRSNILLRLQLETSLLHSAVQTVLGYFPDAMQAWFASVFPEWTLPSQLILKMQNMDWEEEFNAEKAVYAKLRPLQGTIIPKLLGELQYDNTRALLMSDIGGVCLAAPEGAMLELDEFRRLVRQTLVLLSRFGVSQDDYKLDKFHLIDDKVIVVDLEMMNYESRGHLTDEQVEFDIDYRADLLAKLYEDNQYYFWEDGILSVGDE